MNPEGWETDRSTFSCGDRCRLPGDVASDGQMRRRAIEEETGISPWSRYHVDWFDGILASGNADADDQTEEALRGGR